MDLTQYYSDIREAESQISDPFVHVMSLDNRGRGWKAGSVAQVSRNNAAKLITDGSHRLAKPEEVAAFHAQQEAQRVKTQQTEASKIANVIVGRLTQQEPAPVASAKKDDKKPAAAQPQS